MTLKRHISKTLGPKAAYLVTSLYEKGRPIFRLKDVAKILGLDKNSSANFVRKLVNRGVVTRLKPGLFILVPFEMGRERDYVGEPPLVAREILAGSGYYLSHGTAMEIHQMVTQPQLVVFTSVLKSRRPVRVLGTQFRFIHTPKKYFFGITEHWATKQEKVRVSDIEKTVVDGLRQPEYCGGLTEVAKGLWMQRQSLKPELLIEYAQKTEVGSVARRLGFLLELYRIGQDKNLEALRESLTDTYARLDPSLPAEGKFLGRWRLQLNVPQEELLSVVRT